jgi:protein-tyrosine phosphatase
MSVRICFVCLGNICRSPTAEAVMRGLLEQEGLRELVDIDSAGTGAWHVGEPPDHRARAAGKRRGLHVGGKARKVVREDFERFDLLIAMDRSNHADLLRLAPTDEAAARIYLLRDFDEECPTGSEVPDPYYGGGDGFEQVLEICEAGCRGLLDYVRERHLR